MPDKILIVEDEEAIADLLVYALESEGFTVIWKNLAAEGMRYLQESGADLVILDVGLPDENGFELCKRIRTESSVPIMFLTARKEELDRIVGLEIGADDYVAKPFSPREVSSRVKSILRRTRTLPPGSAVQTANDKLFVCDDEGKTIRYFGEHLDLTRYEYRLLHLLIQQPNRVFSRSQLMDHVWEEPDASFERAVDTQIKGLRAKMRAINSEFDPLQTHRGMGYSLSVRQ